MPSEARPSAACELLEAIAYDGPALTWIELADILGIKVDEDGCLPGVELANACLHVQTNPNLDSLTHEERIRTIATAAAALGALRR
jgi:hypothetical protein